MPAPRRGNLFIEDSALAKYLQLFLEKSSVEQQIKMEEDIFKFGYTVISKRYRSMARIAEEYPPFFEHYDAYAKKVHKIYTSEGWNFFKGEAAKEGLISLPYTQMDTNPNARLHQIVKLFFFCAQSASYSCPLAMTDGAAFTLR